MNKLIILLSILIFTSSCRNNGENQIEVYLESWNSSLNKKDSDEIDKFYKEKIQYYGKELTQKEVKKHKSIFFRKYPDFEQRINKIKSVEKKSEDEIKVEYQKFTKYGNKEFEVESIIIWEKVGDNWLIALENDSKIISSTKAAEKDNLSVNLAKKDSTKTIKLNYDDGKWDEMESKELNGILKKSRWEHWTIKGTWLSAYCLNFKDSIKINDYGEIKMISRLQVQVVEKDTMKLEALLEKEIKVIGKVVPAETSWFLTDYVIYPDEIE